MNKTYSALYDSLEERGIDVSKFYFIDTVSPSLFKMIPTKNNCTFVNSIDDNSAFATTILDTVKLKKCDLLIFDSLSSVLVYKYDNELMSLMQYLVPFFKKLKIDVYLFALTEDRKRNAIKQVEMLVDKSVSSD
jgi:archaellum biogenesis ATPase FlaH